MASLFVSTSGAVSVGPSLEDFQADPAEVVSVCSSWDFEEDVLSHWEDLDYEITREEWEEEWEAEQAALQAFVASVFAEAQAVA